MNELKQVAELIRTSRRVVVLTGAGVSAESGIPTFRDAQTGLWERYRPEDLATPEAFRRDPRTVWSWYAWRRSMVSSVTPNRGHVALATLERLLSDFTLITQNVDGLHRRAGSRNVVELHGNILRVRCFHNCISYESGDPSPEARAVFAWDHRASNTTKVSEDSSDAVGAKGSVLIREVPRCPVCGDYLRPDVVWFGESLPEEAIHRAFSATEAADLLFSIGTSSIVYPAAMLPELAVRAGVPVVEINPGETPLSPSATISIRDNAGEALSALVEEVERDGRA